MQASRILYRGIRGHACADGECSCPMRRRHSIQGVTSQVYDVEGDSIAAGCLGFSWLRFPAPVNPSIATTSRFAPDAWLEAGQV